MIILMQLINRMYALKMNEGEICGVLSDLEANAFDTYIQTEFTNLGFEPLSCNQIKRFKESVSKWESALNVTNMRQAA